MYRGGRRKKVLSSAVSFSKCRQQPGLSQAQVKRWVLIWGIRLLLRGLQAGAEPRLSPRKSNVRRRDHPKARPDSCPVPSLLDLQLVESTNERPVDIRGQLYIWQKGWKWLLNLKGTIIYEYSILKLYWKIWLRFILVKKIFNSRYNFCMIHTVIFRFMIHTDGFVRETYSWFLVLFGFGEYFNT